MSTFCLCSRCKHMSSGTYAFGGYTEVICRTEYGIRPVKPKVMVDHNGKDDKRYDDPTDVCERFEPKEDK